MNQLLLYAISRVIPGVINFASLSIYTRSLGPQEYGVYSLIIAIVALINNLVFWWIRNAFARYYNDIDLNERNIFFRAIIDIFTKSSFLLILICLPVMFFTDIDSTIFVAFIGLGIFLGIFELYLETLRIKFLAKSYTLLLVAKSTLSLIFGCVVVFLNLGAVSLVLSQMLVLFLLTIGPVIKNIRLFKLKTDTAVRKNLLGYGLPLIFTFGFNYILSTSDRLLIYWMKGSYETGGYSAAYDLVSYTLVLLMMIIYTYSTPKIYKSINQSPGILEKTLKQTQMLLMLISFPSTLGLIIIAPNLTLLIFGEEYLEVSASIIPLIAVSVMLAGFKSYYFDLAFHISKKTKLLVIPTTVAAISNILLNVLLIPKYSAVGAAYATLLSYFLGIGVSIILGSKQKKLPILKMDLVKYLLIGIVITPLTLLISLDNVLVDTIVTILLFVVIYVSMILILNPSNVRNYLKLKLPSNN
jgi:O-antigen/teichoic acid export membrane protein